MNKIFKAAILVMAMASASIAFGQGTGYGSANNQLPNNETITVIIPEKGLNCPNSGEVRSEWKWVHVTDPQDLFWKKGTTAIYYNPPTSVQVHSISVEHPQAWKYVPQRVQVLVIPSGAYGPGLGYADKPFNPITITPGPCSDPPPPWDNDLHEYQYPNPN